MSWLHPELAEIDGCPHILSQHGQVCIGRRTSCLDLAKVCLARGKWTHTTCTGPSYQLILERLGESDTGKGTAPHNERKDDWEKHVAMESKSE